MADPTHSRGTNSHDPEHVPVLEDALSSTAKSVSEEVISLAEETATIEKRQAITGRVRVQTVTDTLEDVVHGEVRHESVEVTRVPVDRIVDHAPEIRTEGELTIVPVLEEILVVEKRLVLKEELHIRRRATTETAEVLVTLRKQRVVVERIDPDKATGD
jgi:uncharacterized protein (TIGR02271 family)